MEEFQQDQDTIIQQLRLLLAAKEEEFAAFRKRGNGAGSEPKSDSVTDQLLKDLEEKKSELAELRARVKGVEANARQKLSKLGCQIEEKDKIIASLQSVSVAAPADVADRESGVVRLEEALAAEKKEKEERISALEESLKVKEDLLLAARNNSEMSGAGDQSPVAQQLKEEIEILRRRGSESVQLYEEKIATLQRELDSLRNEARAPHADESLRTLEKQLEEREMSYRTVQIQLHRLTRVQQILQGTCAALSVFLVFLFAMKTRQPAGSDLYPIATHVAPAEAGNPARAERLAPTHKEKAVISDDTDAFALKQLASKTNPASTEYAPRKSEERIAYTIQKGDNLWLICQRILGDTRCMEMVAKDNNIADPKSLKVGERIYLSRK